MLVLLAYLFGSVRIHSWVITETRNYQRDGIIINAQTVIPRQTRKQCWMKYYQTICCFHVFTVLWMSTWCQCLQIYKVFTEEDKIADTLWCCSLMKTISQQAVNVVARHTDSHYAGWRRNTVSIFFPLHVALSHTMYWEFLYRWTI